MTRIVISAVTTFVIISGLAFVGAIFLLRKIGETPDWTILLVCALLGAIASAQDLRASFRMPPISDGNTSIHDVLKIIENQKTDEDTSVTKKN